MHIAGFFRFTRITFVKKHREHGDIYTIYFRPARPLKHIAGQHGVFVLPGLRGLHIFSLSSAPEEEYVTISTHVRKESRYKQALQALRPGDKMWVIGPYFDFIFKRDVRDYVFLAQGIGITPFRSLLFHADATGLPVTTTLIHVDKGPHTFQDLTQKLATKAYYPTDPEAFSDLVKKEARRESRLYYVSGSSRFIRSTRQLLREQGVARQHIRKDSFLGY